MCLSAKGNATMEASAFILTLACGHHQINISKNEINHKVIENTEFSEFTHFK